MNKIKNPNQGYNFLWPWQSWVTIFYHYFFFFPLPHNFCNACAGANKNHPVIISNSSPAIATCFSAIWHQFSIPASTSPTGVSGQITWSVADGRQMEPFARNWLMVSTPRGGSCPFRGDDNTQRLSSPTSKLERSDERTTYLAGKWLWWEINGLSGNGFPVGVNFWMSVKHMNMNERAPGVWGGGGSNLLIVYMQLKSS